MSRSESGRGGVMRWPFRRRKVLGWVSAKARVSARFLAGSKPSPQLNTYYAFGYKAGGYVFRYIPTPSVYRYAYGYRVGGY